MRTKTIQSSVFGLITATITSVVLFFIFANTGHAAACQPAAGFGSVTQSGVTTASSGQYNVWVRMQGADPMQNSVGVEVTPTGGSPTCLIASSANFTGWEWRNAGQVGVTQSGNTLRIVGLAAKVKVDRVILVPANITCTPSNTRNTSKNPIEEPGDNCLAAASTPVQSTSVTVSPSPTATPTTSVTPSSTPTPTPPSPTADKNPPTAPTKISRALVADLVRGRYNLELKWTPSADAEGAVAYYSVKRNGQAMTPVTTAKFVDTTLVPDTKYTYDLQAYDKAGNPSQVSQTTLTGRCFLIWCWIE